MRLASTGKRGLLRGCTAGWRVIVLLLGRTPRIVSQPLTARPAANSVFNASARFQDRLTHAIGRGNTRTPVDITAIPEVIPALGIRAGAARLGGLYRDPVTVPTPKRLSSSESVLIPRINAGARAGNERPLRLRWSGT